MTGVGRRIDALSAVPAESMATVVSLRFESMVQPLVREPLASRCCWASGRRPGGPGTQVGSASFGRGSHRKLARSTTPCGDLGTPNAGSIDCGEIRPQEATDELINHNRRHRTRMNVASVIRLYRLGAGGCSCP
jgi:hypothetical protein